MENNEDYFSTKDLHFAAFLKLAGANLRKLEKKMEQYKGRTPVFFIFDDRDKCEYLETIFWNGQGDEIMVNVKDYVDAVRDLRSRTASVNIVQSRSEDFYK